MVNENVLVIMADEHARSVMGAYGDSLAKTPTLDRLANSGIRFTSAYTPSPICISARASFATGTYVFENKCWSSAEPYYGQQESWMHRLRNRGHKVASIGKLHYRSKRDDLGFTEQIRPMYVANEGIGWPQALLRKPLPVYAEASELAAGVGPGETSYTRYDREITREAISWLRQNLDQDSEKPWVLFVSFVCPHYPLSAPTQFYDLFSDSEFPIPYDRDARNQLQHPVIEAMRAFWNYDDYFSASGRVEALRNYYGLCSFLDDNVRQVLQVLEENDALENTHIIYTSDHGELMGNHGMWCKSFMYEDSVGIPMIYKGPGIDPGINRTPVSLVDVASTIEAIAGENSRIVEEDWHGRPFQDFAKAPHVDRTILSEYHDGGSPCGVFMIRSSCWKYVYYSEGNPDLLFNLDDDPQELINLADTDTYSDVKKNLQGKLYAICDPESVNKQALRDQERLVGKLGGVEVVNRLEGYNHTPVEF